MNTPARVPWTRSHCVLGFHAKRSATILGLGFAGRQCVGPANPLCLGLTTQIIGARFWLPDNLSRHAESPRPDRRSRPVVGQFSDTAFFTSAAILAPSARSLTGKVSCMLFLRVSRTTYSHVSPNSSRAG